MLELSRYPLSRTGYFVRWGILGVCAAPLLGAYFYNQGWRVPFLGCPIRHFTGIPCPTCGMTRSFMAVAAGDWNQAFTQHLFGPFLFVICAIAVIHAAIELRFGHKFITPYNRTICDRRTEIIGLILFLSYYALRLYFLFSTGELYLTFSQSPVGKTIIGY
jgi:hypothetical protein